MPPENMSQMYDPQSATHSLSCPVTQEKHTGLLGDELWQVSGVKQVKLCQT